MEFKKKTHYKTSLIRGGINRTNFNETSEALFLNSGFVYKTAEEAEKAFKEKKKRFMYSRFGNPSIDSFQNKLALLEGAEACWATSTGMSAVFTIFMSQLNAGDRVVSSKALFGSCHYIITKILPRFNIDIELIDGSNIEAWRKALKKKTKLIFFETPSNPCLELVDIEAVSKLAKKNGAKVIVDNVFASPILQKPMLFGADIVMYSATKHIDGQGRVLGGAILGTKKFCEDVIKPFIRNTGPSISPFNAWILLKSLDTLELRVIQQTKNANKVCNFLEQNQFIEEVYYPGSKNFKQHKLAKKQMLGGGTLISFKVKKRKNESYKETTFKFLNKLKIIDISNNLGDTKSLITHPSTTTHHRLKNIEKKKLQISENLVRLSVGLENVDDIILDIENSLGKR